MEDSGVPNNVPFVSDCLIGLFVMLSPDVRFSEEQLRTFLSKESQSYPFFKAFFRPRKTECGDKTDGLADLLFRFDLLRDVTWNSFSVRRRASEAYKKVLRDGDVLPRHQQFLQGLADRFEDMLKEAQKSEQRAQEARA